VAESLRCADVAPLFAAGREPRVSALCRLRN
jgi:hypothetical protein